MPIIPDLTITLRARGSAAPAEVWDRYRYFARWASWSPQIRSVRAATDRIRTGVTGTVHGPLCVAVRFEVTDVDDADRTWAWRVCLGPLTLRLWHGVHTDPRGSATTLRITGPAPAVLGYAPVAQLALNRLVQAGS